jgi:hypothetical protein
MALNLQTPINIIHQWLAANEPAISDEDTQLLACEGDIVVTRHGRGFFVGNVTEIYQDSDGNDWLTVEWYGQRWNVMDDSVLEIIRQ